MGWGRGCPVPAEGPDQGEQRMRQNCCPQSYFHKLRLSTGRGCCSGHCPENGILQARGLRQAQERPGTHLRRLRKGVSTSNILLLPCCYSPAVAPLLLLLLACQHEFENLINLHDSELDLRKSGVQGRVIYDVGVLCESGGLNIWLNPNADITLTCIPCVP